MLALLEKPESYDQQINNMQAAMDARVLEWVEGRRGEALRKLFLLTAQVVWILESVGFNDQLLPDDEEE